MTYPIQVQAAREHNFISCWSISLIFKVYRCVRDCLYLNSSFRLIVGILNNQ